jgi:hypothetical protein
MWEKVVAMILLSPTMVRRSLNAYMGMALISELNVVPRSQIIVVQHCIKTKNIIAKPKSFQNKQIMVFMLHVMLFIS